jgi:acetyl esterase
VVAERRPSARERLELGVVRALASLPAPAQLALAGGRPVRADGQLLEPEVQLTLKLLELSGRRSFEQLPVDEARAEVRAEAALVAGAPLPMRRVEELALPGPAGPVAARLYVAHGVPDPAPLLVYFHGGGFVVGDLDSHDATCRFLSREAGVKVLAVHYRRAPEHRFPAAVEDAAAALRFASAEAERLGVDPARIAVGGDSAGANLAAVTALALRGAADAPAFQLLVYPGLDMTRKRPSRLRFGEGFVLTEENMTWYEDQYVPDRDRRDDPRVSPMVAPNLAGVAPAHVATALADPLRDEGEEYAARLRAAGVPVAVYRHPQIHGFFNLTAMRSGLRALTLIAGALRQGLA